VEVSSFLGSFSWNGAYEAATSFRGGGFTDWRLPTSGELSLMYENLHRNGLGGFADARYWGGRVTPGGNFSYFFDFGTNSLDSVDSWGFTINGVSTSTGSSMRVRAVRSFTAEDENGTGGTTLTIRNESQFDITHVQWGDFDFTSDSDPIIGPGRSVTMTVQPGGSFIRFRPRLNPFRLRSDQILTVIEGEAQTFTITDNTIMLREVGNVRGTLASVAQAQLEIGDTGPGGGTIFFASGGNFREVSDFLGMHNWHNADIAARNHEGGGFEDWRLPDGGDLAVMYENLHRDGLGGFADARYWGGRVTLGGTSSHYFDFGTGILSTAWDAGGSTETWTNMRVRAVRTFSTN